MLLSAKQPTEINVEKSNEADHTTLASLGQIPTKSQQKQWPASDVMTSESSETVDKKTHYDIPAESRMVSGVSRKHYLTKD